MLCGILIIGAIIGYFILNKEDEFEFKQDYTVEKYDINEVIPIYITEEDLAKKYLAEYANLLNNDPEKAYDLLSDESRIKYGTLSDFKKYIVELQTNGFVKSKVVKYVYSTTNNKKCMNIVDSAGNKYVFIIDSLMEYKVTIN